MKMRKKKCTATKIKFEDFCSHFNMTDKDSFKICRVMLENVWNQSLNANKRPLIVIGIRRNDNEVFTITGELTVEKQRKSK
jgi:hypothetical protein